MFQLKDKVRLNYKARKWVSGHGIVWYKQDDLVIGNIYTVEDTTIDGGSQFLCLEESELTYPDWCFDLVEKSNSGKYETEPNWIKIG
jgi:hypothetical protein